MATLWWNTRSGYRRGRRAGHGDSPSRSGGGRSILWERRQPVCEEVTIGSIQGFPNLLSQLGRGADVLGLPVSQGCDPIRQREGHRQHPDPRDHSQTGRQVGHNPAPVPGLVGGPLIDAERRADDPVNLPSAVLILKVAALQPVAASAGGVRCSFRRLRFMPGCIVRPTDARFCRSVPKCPASSTLLCDRAELGSAGQRR